MHWIRLLVVCLAGLLSVSCSRNSGKTPPTIVDGVIDVTKWDFEHDGPILLNGDWAIESEGSYDSDKPQVNREFIQFPWTTWPWQLRFGRPMAEVRWIKLSIQIIANTAPLVLDFDGRPLADSFLAKCSSGGDGHLEQGTRDEFVGGINPSAPWKQVQLRSSGSLILHGPTNCSILIGKTGKGFQVYNSVRLISPRDIGLWSTGTIALTIAVLSTVCLLFALLLVTLDRRDKVPRWSAMYLAAWTVRLWVHAKSILLPGFLIQASGDWLWFRIEFIALWIALWAIVRYGETLAVRRIYGSCWVGIVTLILSFIAGFLSLDLNILVLKFGHAAFIYFGAGVLLNLYRKSASSYSALVALVGLGVVLMGGAAYSINLAIGSRIHPLFLAMMTSEPIFQMVVLCIRTAEARSRSERLAAATTQFVPREFLHALGHDDVTTAKLGDAISRKVTVLFADIRNFTTLSEKMSPEETFRFLNACLSRIGPHIRANRGFVDKYIGDAIMALFPESPADAVRAALAMQREVQAYNAKTQGKTPLAIGLGIHVGQVMMGTIGEEQRFEATVISDAVNLTARIETLTKQLGCSILVSADVAQQLSAEDSRYVRTLGTFAVKGKSTPVELIEIFDSDGNELRARKADSRTPFAKALDHYTRGDLAAAADIVSTLAAAAPDDGPMAWWNARLQKESTMASKASSFGVVRLDEK